MSNPFEGNMPEADKQELLQFLQGEKQKTAIQAGIHNLTDMCFRKCISGGKISSGKLDRTEEPCLQNCVDRFMDAQSLVLKQLEQMRGV